MKIQKRLAGQLLKASPKRIKFDNSRLADIKEAITKTDIRILIDEKAITKEQEKGVSRGRARKVKNQKSKGNRKGRGSKEGKRGARITRKQEWMNKIRSQRELIQDLREKEAITKETFRLIYAKAKGGYFRSRRHIQIYLEENKLLTKQPKKQEEKQEVKKASAKKTVKKAAKKKRPMKKKATKRKAVRRKRR